MHKSVTFVAAVFAAQVAAAVGLSLTATNDYVYTVPATTNLAGIGMGESGDYHMLREEDVAFLREAYAERYDAVGAVPRPELFPATTRALVGPFGYLWDSYLCYLFPESFDSPYWYNARGLANSFVAPDFALGSGWTTCGSNWVVRIDERDIDLDRSYLPYVQSFGTRLVPPDNLRTNAYHSGHRAVTMDAITNAYHDLSIMTDIVTAPAETLLETNDLDNTYAEMRYGYSPTFEYAEVRNSAGQVVDRYLSSYTLGNPIYTIVPSHASGGYVGYEERYEAVDTRVARIGWRLENPDRTGGESPRYARVALNPFVSRHDVSRNVDSAARVDLRCWTPLITASNAHLVTDLEIHKLVGFSRHYRERVVNAGAESTVEDSRTHMVWHLRMSGRPRRVGTIADHGRDCVVFGAPASYPWTIHGDLNSFRTACGDSSISAIAAPNPDLSGMPDHTSWPPASEVVSSRIRAYTWRIEWVRFIFRFKRDFNAKVINNDNRIDP